MSPKTIKKNCAKTITQLNGKKYGNIKIKLDPRIQEKSENILERIKKLKLPSENKTANGSAKQAP